MSRWPRASRQARHSRTWRGLPRTIVSSAASARCRAAASRSGAAARVHVAPGPSSSRTRSSWAVQSVGGALQLAWRSRSALTTASGRIAHEVVVGETWRASCRGRLRARARQLAEALGLGGGVDQAGHGHEQRAARRRARWPTGGAASPAASARGGSMPARRSSQARCAPDELEVAARCRCSSSSGMRREGADVHLAADLAHGRG